MQIKNLNTPNIIHITFTVDLFKRYNKFLSIPFVPIFRFGNKNVLFFINFGKITTALTIYYTIDKTSFIPSTPHESKGYLIYLS